MVVIRKARVLAADGPIANGTVVVEGEQITAVGGADLPVPKGAAEVIDGTGCLLVPGFIDLQLNGGFGLDFTADPRTIWTVAAELPRYGVTRFLPTIITAPLAVTARAQAVLAEQPSGWRGALPIGLHVEGPFLNPAKKGAHNPAHLRPPDVAAVRDWSPATGVRLVTLAPELAGAAELIGALTAAGVVVSAGHSMATLAEAATAFEAGVRYATHLFNAMPLLHHREPGLAAAVLGDERITVGLIPDGVHVHAALVKLVWQLAGERLNLVTDAMAAMGWRDGRYVLGDFEVTVADGRATLGDGTLAGSVITLDAALRNLVLWTGCNPAEAIRTVTQTPADLLGLTNVGRIAVGCAADLVLLTPDFQVATTIVAGEIIYEG